MQVSTLNPRMAGTEMPFTIYLQRYVIRMGGIVLHSYTSDEGPLRTPGMRIKYTQIKPQDQAMIRAFINRQLMQYLDGGMGQGDCPVFRAQGRDTLHSSKKATGFDRRLFL